MKTIIINEKATIEANGALTTGHCKPVICIDTGDVYTSATDAAEAIGTSISNMSFYLCGKSNTIKGKRFCYLSKVNESLNAITTRLRETSEMEAKAKMWDAMMAEQEAARKAEEKRIAEERKAEEKRKAEIAKLEERERIMNEKYMKRYEEAIALFTQLSEVRRELREIKGEEEMEEIA